MTAPTHIDLPRRMGDRPQTSGPMPNIQLDQLGSTDLHEALKARLFALPDVEERQTIVSDPRARAMWLREGVPLGDHDAFLGGREFGHFHPWDRSMHVILPMDVAGAAVRAGWAEVHPAVPLLGLPKNRLMVYGPRDDAELEVVHGLLLEAYRYAGGRLQGMSGERETRP
jgi:luciferase-like monooxygenase